jgi:cytolysin (calcineurin-like family phosphatase)
LLGDITEQRPLAWPAFTNDWGLTGERLLHFPVYEGFGNHDCLDPAVPNHIKERNPLRPHLSNISSNGYHYSWDWDSVHFVCLNLFPGNEMDTQHPPHDPKGSLDFLIQDLAAKVGNSGRPVITCHHYGLDENSNLWWTDQQRTNFFEAVKNYNLIYVLAGHTHNIFFTRWHGLETCNDGSIGRFSGDFVVGHITRTNLTLVARRADNTWADFFTKPITNGIAQGK